MDISNERFEFEKALEIYKTCIERIEKVNTFYVSLQTALITLFGFIVNQAKDLEGSTIFAIWILAPMGVVLSISWLLAIKKQYFDKEKIKERLLNLEPKLGMNFLSYTLYKQKKAKYLSTSQYEELAPFIFILLHILLFLKFL